MTQNYRRLYGKTQEEIYFILRKKGFKESRIQRDYKIPQASLRRCRYKYNNGTSNQK